MQREVTRMHYARMLNKIDEFCEANIHESFGIREVAEYVGMSYHHLAEVFGHLRNTSPGAYITAKKLDRAAQLCFYTGLNLAQVAEKTGYATRHSLAKAFANRFGVSPGQLTRRVPYSRSSPNVLMDGIRSENEYLSLLKKELDFSCRNVFINNAYLAGNTWQVGYGIHQHGHTCHARMKSMTGNEATLRHGRMCIRAFDSLNFSDPGSFKFFHGVYLETGEPETLQKSFSDYVLIPLKKGDYLVFDVPAGPEHDVGVYITLCRENAIWYKRHFALEDFYDFFIFSTDDPAKAGEYYIRTGRQIV